MANTEKKKFQFKMPHTYVILVSIMVLMSSPSCSQKRIVAAGTSNSFDTSPMEKISSILHL